MAFPIAKYEEWFLQEEEKIKEAYARFLSFQSISTNPAHKKDCLDTADWLKELLQQIGMEAELLPSAGLPVVFAEYEGLHSKVPTVLLYQHYDVQPVDPIALWKGDPFHARWEEGKVFARGASDNKGQCFLTIHALKALLAMEKDMPLHIKLFIEGEEESGSQGTAEVIRREQKRLVSDYLCVMDFDLKAPGIPSIMLGYRGLVTAEIECTNASTDLHSGSHGGMALNPIHILAGLISRFWDEKGQIAIPHFYDGVETLSEEDRKKMDFSLDEDLYRQEYGIGAFCNEKGFSLKERGGLRPTIEVNGLWGGYTGPGFKTVIPGTAYAKLSCRLVPGQDPKEIEKHVTSFLEKNTPKGAKLSIKWGHGAPAFRTSLRSPLVQIIEKSLEDVFKKPCSYTLCGGSVPIVRELAEAAQGDVALFGFALATDNIHAPNEHFRWDSFKKGFLSMAEILWTMAQEKKDV